MVAVGDEACGQNLGGRREPYHARLGQKLRLRLGLGERAAARGNHEGLLMCQQLLEGGEFQAAKPRLPAPREQLAHRTLRTRFDLGVEVFVRKAEGARDKRGDR